MDGFLDSFAHLEEDIANCFKPEQGVIWALSQVGVLCETLSHCGEGVSLGSKNFLFLEQPNADGVMM